MLEYALGYRDTAALVALVRVPTDDTLIIMDGRINVQGDAAAYHFFIEHPLVAPYLSTFGGAAARAAAHDWLVLDRRYRVLYVLPVHEGHMLIQRQHPPASDAPTVLGASMMNGLRKRLDATLRQAHAPATMDAVTGEQQHQVVALRRWLNAKLN